MTNVIDLDAARAARDAARREEGNTGPKVVFGGVEYNLPTEMPYAVLESMRGMGSEETVGAAMVEMVEAILGDAYASFIAMDPKPTFDDLEALLDGVFEVYGVTGPLASSTS